MDTDDLSKETYKAIMIESEKFNNDLTLQFGLLSYDCNDEDEFISHSEKLIKRLKVVNSEEIKDVFFGKAPNLIKLSKTLDKILDNIAKVKQMPKEKRHFEF